MPPVEQNGKQVELVDSSGHPVDFNNYFNTKAAMALQGQVYNPTLGFATIGNVVGASHKYPFNPFYGGVSPRVAVAWNPTYSDGILGKVFGNGKTVIRAGYGQIYSRLNGVGLVLLPLLGVGLGQPIACVGASMTGQCSGYRRRNSRQCLSNWNRRFNSADSGAFSDPSPAVLSGHQRDLCRRCGIGPRSELPPSRDLQRQLQYPA